MSKTNDNKIKTLEKFIEKYYYIIYLVVLVVAAINLFYKLNTTVIQDWDEARHGVTAFEMLKNNNFLVTTYGNTVDYFNLKPPLGIWMIAGAYKIFGYNIFALRIVSALSSFITITIVARFLRENVSKMASIIGAAILSCNVLFVSWHTGRTGDMDGF